MGFDDRIFGKLELDDFEFEYLNWIEPTRDESIKEYAVRFSKRIKEDTRNIILIGHSFGGIIAQEIAEFKQIDQIILLSSIKSRRELPVHFKLAKPLQIHKLFTKGLTTKTIKYWGKTHGYETREEQNLVVDMVNRYSNYYLEWSLKQLSSWKKTKSKHATMIFQIHGELDKTFPVKLIEPPAKIIQKAGHFMVYKKPKLITNIILAALQEEV